MSAAVAFGAPALGEPVLHFDVNNITAQATVGGVAAAFGGVTHTGALAFGYTAGISTLASISVHPYFGGPGADQGFNGQLTGFTGHIDLANGQVVGGGILLQAGSDFYQASVVPGVGAVAASPQGWFTLQGLTFGGQFGDPLFGNVDISTWFSTGLAGSFLQFKFNPSPAGFSYADIDLFVESVPLPSSVLAGLGTIGLGLAFRASRRR
ncbi:MAG: hypothetical protein WD749_02410 [Phycisphaerales bacterium]